jgi:hypothetical protein
MFLDTKFMFSYTLHIYSIVCVYLCVTFGRRHIELYMLSTVKYILRVLAGNRNIKRTFFFPDFRALHMKYFIHRYTYMMVVEKQECFEKVS